MTDRPTITTGHRITVGRCDLCHRIDRDTVQEFISYDHHEDICWRCIDETDCQQEITA